MAERETRPRNGEVEEPEAGEREGRDAREELPGDIQEELPSDIQEELPGDIREELARCKAEAEQNWQQFLHAAADLENYKKQAVRARDEAVARTRRMMLGVILGVVDTIERALGYGAATGGSANSAVAILDGIRMTHRQVLDQLGAMGVRPLEAKGRPFDPRYHEAVEVVAASPEHPAGTVVAVVRPGYLMDDEVLRPAQVRVAQSQPVGEAAAELE